MLKIHTYIMRRHAAGHQFRRHLLSQEADIIVNDLNFIRHKDISHLHLLYIYCFYIFLMLHI